MQVIWIRYGMHELNSLLDRHMFVNGWKVVNDIHLMFHFMNLKCL